MQGASLNPGKCNEKLPPWKKFSQENYKGEHTLHNRPNMALEEEEEVDDGRAAYRGFRTLYLSKYVGYQIHSYF